jgi:transcriptional regulator with XRE-family HTH domain
MAIYLNEKLKQFRKARDLTQEQIADIFHVSPQAVSRWETGVSFPDIEMLPNIADFFKVTVDDLLGVDMIQKEKRIIEIINELADCINADIKMPDAEIELLRKGLQEFPNQYALLDRLAGSLWSKAWDCKNAGNEEEMKKHAEEAIKIGELLLSDWSQSDIRYGNMPELEQRYGYTYERVRYGAIQLLAYTYANFFDDTEKAFEWAKKLPNIDCSEETVLARILKGDAKIKQLKWNISLYSCELKAELQMLSECKYKDSDIPEELKRFKEVIAEIEKYAKEENE